MGNKFQKAVRAFGDRDARILMLGLDAAGKTTILYKLKLKEHINSIPTIGINVETVTVMKNISFTVWDVGGQEKVRPFWRHFYQNTEGLLFVVDSADNDRLHEARDELYNILTDELMSPGVPVVVLGNKQDLPNASKGYELVSKLDLNELTDNPWHIQEICALTGDGLYEGVQRLAVMVKEFHKRKGK